MLPHLLFVKGAACPGHKATGIAAGHLPLPSPLRFGSATLRFRPVLSKSQGADIRIFSLSEALDLDSDASGSIRRMS
jgi:hypothetical protein